MAISLVLTAAIVAAIVALARRRLRRSRLPRAARRGGAGGSVGLAGAHPGPATTVPPSAAHCASFLTGAQSSPVTMLAMSFAGRQHASGFFFGVAVRPHEDRLTAFLSALISEDFFWVVSSFLISFLTHLRNWTFVDVWQLQVPRTASSMICPRISPPGFVAV